MTAWATGRCLLNVLVRSRSAVDAPITDGVESGIDGAQKHVTSSHQEDEMSGTAGTVLRASRLRMELAG